MQELISRGPVPVVINAPDNFHEYKSGILFSRSPVLPSEISLISTHSVSFLTLQKHPVSDVTLRENDIEFEYANHSVVILGWGYDADLDLEYWICANSWGPEWGEQGYFRVVRGSDEMAIESAAEFFTVRVELNGQPVIF